MVRRFAVITVLLAATVGAAHAQYYQQPPDGYPPQAPPREYAPPPGEYGAPGGYPPQGELQQPDGVRPGGYGYGGYGPPGSRCNAFFETRNGPRQRVCPMGVAKPVGAPCACPPRGPYGPTAQGRVIP